jgi:hypothetical protein
MQIEGSKKVRTICIIDMILVAFGEFAQRHTEKHHVSHAVNSAGGDCRFLEQDSLHHVLEENSTVYTTRASVILVELTKNFGMLLVCQGLLSSRSHKLSHRGFKGLETSFTPRSQWIVENIFAILEVVVYPFRTVLWSLSKEEMRPLGTFPTLYSLLLIETDQ